MRNRFLRCLLKFLVSKNVHGKNIKQPDYTKKIWCFQYKNEGLGLSRSLHCRRSRDVQGLSYPWRAFKLVLRRTKTCSHAKITLKHTKLSSESISMPCKLWLHYSIPKDCFHKLFELSLQTLVFPSSEPRFSWFKKIKKIKTFCLFSKIYLYIQKWGLYNSFSSMIRTWLYPSMKKQFTCIFGRYESRVYEKALQMTDHSV